MPRPASVNADEIVEALSDVAIFDQNGNLKPLTNHAIWSLAVKKLKFKIQKKNLHQRIQQNRGELLKRLKNSFLINGNVSPSLPINKNVFQNECIPKDEYDSLHELALCNERYMNVVNDLSVRPFSIIYQLSEQEDVCCRFADNDCYGMLIIKNLSKKIKMKDYISKNLFFFAYSIKVDKIFFSVSQMIGELITTSLLIRFFMNIIMRIKKIPDLIILPYCEIILNSASYALNKSSFLKYNLDCYRVCLKKDNYLPPIKIKIDTISLLIKNEQILNNLTICKPVKIFLYNCLMYLSTVEVFEEFEDSIRNLIILLLSPYENSLLLNIYADLSKKINSELRQNCYNDYPHYLPNEDNYCNINSVDDYISKSFDSTTELKEYIENMEHHALELIKNTVKDKRIPKINNFYQPSWYKNFLKEILFFFPSWTRLLDNRDSFNELKASVITLVDEKQLEQSTISELVIQDCEQSQKLAQKCRDILYHKTSTKSSYTALNCSPMRLTENWKNRNSEAQDDSSEDEITYETTNDTLDNVIKSTVVDPSTEFSLLEGSITKEESFKFDVNQFNQSSVMEKEYEQYEELDPVLEYLMSSGEVPEWVELDQTINEPSCKIKIKVLYDEPFFRNKSRGHYVTPTNIEVIHAQATTKNQRGPRDLFIKNGCNSKKIFNKKTFFLKDTSIFDSICEIFMFCKKYIKNFDKSCEFERCECKSGLCFFKLIEDLCLAKTLSTFYTKRTKFFMYFGTSDNDYLTCTEPCGEFYTKIFQSHFMFEYKFNCTECSTHNILSCSIMKLFCHNEIISLLAVNVELEIKKSMTIMNKCRNCNKQNLAKKGCTLGKYLAFDLEHATCSTLLCDIPQIIFIEESQFILAGCTARDEESCVRTYIAYTKRSDDSWIRYKSSEKKSTIYKKKERVKLAVIIYAKIC